MAQQKICALSGQSFTISDQEEEYCRSQNIPLPTISPLERIRAITSFDNCIHLYNGKCAFTGQAILTTLPPELGHPTYSPDVYMSDQWDATSFGRDYDFSRPFFEQFADLFKQVPLPSRFLTLSTLENSDFVNGVTGAKNCYLLFNATSCEDCLFSRVLNQCKNTVESISVQNSELCYGCINVSGSYELFWAENCTNCTSSYFLYNCQNLKNCYGCVNLRNKEYCFENEQCTPEQYAAKLQAKNLGSHAAWEQEYLSYSARKKHTVGKYFQGKNNENVTGNYINSSKNVSDGFFVLEAQDVFCGIRVVKANNVFSSAFAANNAQQIYASHGAVNNVSNIRWSVDCPNQTHDLEYCIHSTLGTHDCFGCVGLKRKEYCILNKQYAKEDYVVLLAKIRDHMRSTGEYGQLFPASLSPYYYNHSYAMEFTPLTRAEALQRGYQWKDEQIDPTPTNYVIPDHIRDVQDDILQAVLVCSQTGKKYRLVKAELDIYRRFQIPIPRIAPLVRLENVSRYLQMVPLVSRACVQCQAPLSSVYATEPVLCEDCYQRSLV